MRLNNIIRLMTYSKRYSRVSQLYRYLNLLKFHDIYKFELVNFMYLLHSKKIPIVITSKFTEIERVHSHNIRQVNNYVYFIPQSTKSITQNLLAFGGTKLWSSPEFPELASADPGGPRRPHRGSVTMLQKIKD